MHLIALFLCSEPEHNFLISFAVKPRTKWGISHFKQFTLEIPIVVVTATAVHVFQMNSDNNYTNSQDITNSKRECSYSQITLISI